MPDGDVGVVVPNYFICPYCLMRSVTVKTCKSGLTFRCLSCLSRSFVYSMKPIAILDYLTDLLAQKGFGENFLAQDHIVAEYKKKIMSTEGPKNIPGAGVFVPQAEAE